MMNTARQTASRTQTGYHMINTHAHTHTCTHMNTHSCLHTHVVYMYIHTHDTHTHTYTLLCPSKALLIAIFDKLANY